jgi:hypothetical protein
MSGIGVSVRAERQRVGPMWLKPRAVSERRWAHRDGGTVGLSRLLAADPETPDPDPDEQILRGRPPGTSGPAPVARQLRQRRVNAILQGQAIPAHRSRGRCHQLRTHRAGHRTLRDQGRGQISVDVTRSESVACMHGAGPWPITRSITSAIGPHQSLRHRLPALGQGLPMPKVEPGLDEVGGGEGKRRRHPAVGAMNRKKV